MRSQLVHVLAWVSMFAAAACGKESTAPSGLASPSSSHSEGSGFVASAAAVSGWAPIPAMPAARIGLAAAAVNGVVYAIGGSSAFGQIWIGSIGTTGLATVEAYDVATGSWSQKAPLPEPRVYPAGATVIDGKIYVVGGISPTA